MELWRAVHYLPFLVCLPVDRAPRPVRGKQSVIWLQHTSHQAADSTRVAMTRTFVKVLVSPLAGHNAPAGAIEGASEYSDDHRKNTLVSFPSSIPRCGNECIATIPRHGG